MLCPNRAAGGRAAAIVTRKNSLAAYYKDPNFCIECKSVIKIAENQSAQDARIKKFCTSKCSAIFNNKKRIRIKKPKLLVVKDKYEKFSNVINLTIFEIFKTKKSWQSARGTIQKHARYVYFNSDKAKSCFVCGYDSHCDIAHIKAVKDFDKNSTLKKVNSINNLVALCKNHHWEFDAGKLDITFTKETL